MDKKLEYEKAPKEIVERLAILEEHRQHVATDKDMMRLEGKIDTSVEMLKGFIQDAVSQSEIRTLKQFVRSWTTGAALVIPLLTGLIVVFLTYILPK